MFANPFIALSRVSLFIKRIGCLGMAMCYPMLVTAAESNAAEASDSVVKEIFTPAYLTQMFAGLAIVVGLILVLSVLFKKFSGSSEGMPGNMRVLAGLAVGTRERLVLVQVGQQQILIGVAPGSVNAIKSFDEPIVDPKTEVVPALNRLRGFLGSPVQREAVS
jgi:flagellar protein FliO/FliZ